MKKILLYGNRKSADIAYDASTPELEAAAFMKLFQHLHTEWDVYQELIPLHQKLFSEAQAGNQESARRLLNLRKTYEYEEWRLVKIQE